MVFRGFEKNIQGVKKSEKYMISGKSISPWLLRELVQWQTDVVQMLSILSDIVVILSDILRHRSNMFRDMKNMFINT